MVNGNACHNPAGTAYSPGLWDFGIEPMVRDSKLAEALLIILKVKFLIMAPVAP